MTILVIAQHLMISFGGLGVWYYKEATQYTGMQIVNYNFVQLFIQSFFLSVLFAISGYFIPASYDSKGFSRLAKEKLVRLGVPTLIFMFVLHPIINYAVLRREPFTIPSFLQYIYGFTFIDKSGPLWYAIVLLVFSIAYAAFRKISRARPTSPESGKEGKPFPITPKILLFIVLMSICTLLIRIVQPMGTRVANIPIGFVPQYALMFIVGIICRRNGWLEKLYLSKGLPWLLVCLAIGYNWWYFMIAVMNAYGSDFSLLLGGTSWQAASYALWESYISVSMTIGLVALFKAKLNKQNRLVKAMAENAFAVFVFNSPIIIAFAAIAGSVDASQIAKLLVLIPVSVVASFLFAHFVIRKIPALKKLLA